MNRYFWSRSFNCVVQMKDFIYKGYPSWHYFYKDEEYFVISINAIFSDDLIKELNKGLNL